MVFILTKGAKRYCWVSPFRWTSINFEKRIADRLKIRANADNAQINPAPLKNSTNTKGSVPELEPTVVLIGRIEDGLAEVADRGPAHHVQDDVLQARTDVVIDGDDGGVATQNGATHDISLQKKTTPIKFRTLSDYYEVETM